MEAKNNNLEDNKSLIRGLMSLTPTEDSRTTLVAKGRLSEVKDLDQGTIEARKKLTDFFDNSLTNDQLLLYAELAAKTGDSGLFELVEVKDCLLNEDPLFQSPNKLYVPMKTKFHRNAAVILRDKALQEGKQGLVNRAKLDMDYAKEFYSYYAWDRYSRSRDERQKRRDPKILKEKFKAWEFYNNWVEVLGGEEGLDKIFEDAAKDVAEGRHKASQKIPRTESELFFSPEVIGSVRELKNLITRIAVGSYSLMNVDRRWLNVYSCLKPNEQKYPQAYKEVDKVMQYVADKNEVDLEELKSLFNMKQKEGDWR